MDGDTGESATDSMMRSGAGWAAAKTLASVPYNQVGTCQPVSNNRITSAPDIIRRLQLIMGLTFT
jgi:hypothetical protein